MSTFGAATFGEFLSGGSDVPQWTREAEVEVVHIPGGNTSVIQTAGRMADKVTIKAKVTKANYTTLLGLVGTKATLDFSYGSRSAVLLSIGDAVEKLSYDVYIISLNFVGA